MSSVTKMIDGVDAYKKAADAYQDAKREHEKLHGKADATEAEKEAAEFILQTCSDVMDDTRKNLEDLQILGTMKNMDARNEKLSKLNFSKMIMVSDKSFPLVGETSGKIDVYKKMAVMELYCHN